MPYYIIMCHTYADAFGIFSAAIGLQCFDCFVYLEQERRTLHSKSI